MLTALRNVPTRDIADAPRISTATIRASTVLILISSASADRPVALQARATSPAATAAKHERLKKEVHCLGKLCSPACRETVLGKSEIVTAASIFAFLWSPGQHLTLATQDDRCISVW